MSQHEPHFVRLRIVQHDLGPATSGVQYLQLGNLQERLCLFPDFSETSSQRYISRYGILSALELFFPEEWSYRLQQCLKLSAPGRKYILHACKERK